MKTTYHPAIIVAFYLNCLPDDIAATIPRSTKSDWMKKKESSLFGYNWYCNNQELFTVMKKLAENQSLLKINKTLIRIITLIRFIKNNSVLLANRFCSAQKIVLHRIERMSAVWSLAKILKWLNISYSFYQRLRKKYWCTVSPLRLCPVKHPLQLLHTEVSVIKKYCSAEPYRHWPLASVYHQMKRDYAGFFALSTFYKYVSVLNLQRSQCRSKRKNHDRGIRAAGPLQLLHADVSVYRTADNQKAYICLVQDNFSRALLGWKVETKCCARYCFEICSRFMKITSGHPEWSIAGCLQIMAVRILVM
jgi:hypothetical protein